jgi:hypothetical protein
MNRVSGIRRLVLVVVATAALAGGSVLVASGDTTSSAASNHAAARVAAARALAETPLPAGAVTVGTDPGTGGWLKYPAGGAPATRELVDVHRFWRVPGDPQTVMAWIKAHAPAGARVSGTGSGGVYGTTVMWSLTFSLRPVPGVISEEGLGVAVTAARGGGTALRADGWAIWIVPRPPSEVIPAGVGAVAVFVDRFGGRAFPAGIVSASRAVQRLVSFVDSRQIVPPGTAFSCPEIGPQTRTLDLRFLRTASDASPLARAVEDACGGLTFTVGDRREPALSEAGDLRGLLWRWHVLPVCRASQLAGSVAPVSTVPSPSGLTTQIIMRNRSSAVCALDGFARLALRGAGGRALPTHVANTRYAHEPALLIPGDSAFIGLRWAVPSVGCHGPAAHAIAVRLPGVAGALVVPLAASGRRVAPCRGALHADAIQGA